MDRKVQSVIRAKLEPTAALDGAAQVGLAGVVDLAAQLCAASGALLWILDAGQPRALAGVGVADEEIDAQLARAAALAHGAGERGEAGPLVGAPVRRSDGLTIGGLCVVAPTVPAEPVLAGLAQQAAALLELDERLAEQRRAEQAARADASRLRDVIANVPIVVFVLDRDGLFTLSDGGSLHRLGLRPGQVVGMSAFDVYAAFPVIVDNLRACLRGEPREWIADVGGGTYETRMTPLRGPDGQPAGGIGVAIDVTERVRLEGERKRLQDAVIAVQAATLAEMSTPLIPISRDTMVLPLIGAIDAARAERVLQTLLEGITAARARVAIVDITGVAGMDAQVADCLVRAARAVRLLGAEVVLTGVRPEAAQALVGLDVDLRTIIIRSTLESGIAWALNRR